ncbi:MAG: hypothetical protein JNK02_16330 [Planctomycetes bacterium]|nr:hypothetical protein [Planctomycetota bacterium]
MQELVDELAKGRPMKSVLQCQASRETTGESTLEGAW